MRGTTAQASTGWVLVGATIHARSDPDVRASALLVRDGRVVFVGDDIGARQRGGDRLPLLDGSGWHVYPGFADAHGHLHALGQSLEEVRLDGARSLEEALERVRRASAVLPQSAWLSGRGWNEAEWREERLPTAADLDGVVGPRPAILRRKDGHAIWVSSAVLERARLDALLSDPAGGRIVREETGGPTGVLVDRAMELVERLAPEADRSVVLRRLRAAQRACLEVGLTSVHDMGVDSEVLGALRELDEKGELRLRVYAALLDDERALLEQEFARGPTLPEGGRLTVRAVKLFADGALGSRGAALLEPYADDPSNRGLLLLSPEDLRERIEVAARAGFQPCIHAIGDLGNRVTLDALASLLGEGELGGRLAALRPRVEHAQVVHPLDTPRFALLGLIASMQPVHCVSDMAWAEERLGRERSHGAYAWRALQRLGVPLAFGSDFPVESPDPRLGIHAALTRQTPQGVPFGGWFPEQRLRLDQVLEAFTIGAAYASFAEGQRGRIAPGYDADLTIFDQELSGRDPGDLFEARVVATLVGGSPEFTADPERWSVLTRAPS